IPRGGVRYLDFMAPGVLAQGVLFSSIFYGIAVIWERDLGLAHKLLASPIPRASIVAGKALSAGVRGLAQAVIVYVLAFIMQVDLRWDPIALLGVVLAIFLGAAAFATLSLLIACLVKTRERFLGIGQLLTMPLFFASNAIYPLEIMPDWLRAISVANPLTYEVDALRGLMLAGGEPAFGLAADLAVLLVFAAMLTAATSAVYPRVAT
ncbi:MAG: ABC transporter permease, partial [Planctomycetota bacterium]|nr:ABC transporter permease [Planctomycetota bacterium]